MPCPGGVIRMSPEVVFSRGSHVANLIESLIRESATSLDAAIYRFNNPRLALALAEAVRRGARLRLILDGIKYQADPVARSLCTENHLPFRLSHGARGPSSKMHHKFAILDNRVVLTGSYNWTMESDKENYENLLIVRGPVVIRKYREEFEALWKEAERNA